MSVTKLRFCKVIAATLAAIVGRVMADASGPAPPTLTLEADDPVALEKPVLSAVMTATVWPAGWTEVRWFCDGRVYRAVSNIDCSRLPQMLDWETDAAGYQLTIFAARIDAETVADLTARGELNQDGRPVSWPARALLPVPGGAPECVVGWERAADETEQSLAAATAVLDAFHGYFAVHSLELLAAWQRREAQRPAMEAAVRAAQMENQSKPRGVRFLGAVRAPRALIEEAR